jgi:cytochrome c-type biogenesis protein CcmE
MTRKQRRAVFIVLSIGVLTLAVLLVAVALRDTIVFFHTPKEVAEKNIPAGKRIRLGGLVAEQPHRSPKLVLGHVVKIRGVRVTAEHL